MDKLRTRTHLVHVVIIVLLVLNLIGTMFLIMRARTPSVGPVSAASQAPLPKGLRSPEERRALFEKMKNLFNSGSADEMLAALDPIVQVQQPRGQLDRVMKLGRDVTGDILEGAYSHYEVFGTANEPMTYDLHYQVRAERAETAMCIRVVQQGNEPYRLLGFYISQIK